MLSFVLGVGEINRINRIVLILRKVLGRKNSYKIGNKYNEVSKIIFICIGCFKMLWDYREVV